MDAACEDRLVEMVKVLCKYPWIVEVIKQRSVNSPYMGYMWLGTSEMCISLGRKAYCAQNGAVKETKLESAFSRYEVYEDKMREVYRPKGLLAFTTAAREHVGILQPQDREYEADTNNVNNRHLGRQLKLYSSS